MSMYLDTDNCMEVRHLAVSFGLDHLTQTVDTFLCENFESVSNMGGPLMDMSASDLIRILLSDDLSVQGEESVFNCVSNWMDSRSVLLVIIAGMYCTIE